MEHVSWDHEENTRRACDYLLELKSLTEREQQWLYSCRVRIAGKVIAGYFTEESMIEHFSGIFGGSAAATAPADWTYYCIREDTEKHRKLFGQESCRGRDDTGMIFVRAGRLMYAVDRIHKTLFTYYGPDFEQMVQLYGMRPVLLFQWARAEDMLLLHGAAVGWDSSGVLISEFGGKGKSTLTVSCLLSGLRFISDDYLLVDKNNCAMPTYRTVKLMPDSYQWIRSLYPGLSRLPVVFEDTKQDGKLLLSAAELPFADKLFLKALVRPVVTEEEKPSIQPEDRGMVLTRMIRSTINQMGLTHDTEIVKEISQQFLKMPAYEFRLCRNLQRNVEVLREFIMKL